MDYHNITDEGSQPLNQESSHRSSSSSRNRSSYESDVVTKQRPQPEPDAVCRICQAGKEDGPLFSPCACAGSVRWVHVECLQKWVEARSASTGRGVNPFECELCHTPYDVSIRSVIKCDCEHMCCKPDSCIHLFNTCVILIMMVSMVTVFVALWSSRKMTGTDQTGFIATAFLVPCLGVMTLRKLWTRWRDASSVSVIVPREERRSVVSRIFLQRARRPAEAIVAQSSLSTPLNPV